MLTAYRLRSRHVLASLVVLAACTGTPAPHGAGTPTLSPSASPSASSSPAPNADPVIAAAGDIACDPQTTAQADRQHSTNSSCGQAATVALLEAGGFDAILALGDEQYPSGSLDDYRGAYGPTWGRLKAITFPVPGNHEYGTGSAGGYYQFFGSRAGDAARGYYSFEIGAWHLIALNSNCGAVGGCGVSSPQGRWLRDDLASHRNACTLAFWHHPRFSSGLHGSNTSYDGFWRLLYAGGADVVLVGHDHIFERFAPQNPDGIADPSRGIREFVVGTGGRSHYPILGVVSNSEVRNNQTFGVLSLTLRPHGYDWRFVPVAGSSFTDAGSGACH